MVEQGRCSDCIHFHNDVDKLVTTCRRYPPTAFLAMTPTKLGGMQMSIPSAFPSVTPEHWCGEFNPRPMVKA